MKNSRLNKLGTAGNFVQTDGQSKPFCRDCGRNVLVLLLGLMIGGSHSALAEDPGELFVKTCASCHGRDGKAQTPAAKKLGVKDLSQSKLTDAEIIKQIKEGKPAQDGSSKMPAFNEKLTPDQIQSLVPIVKEFRK